jgi:ribosome-associated protein
VKSTGKAKSVKKTTPKAAAKKTAAKKVAPKAAAKTKSVKKTPSPKSTAKNAAAPRKTASQSKTPKVAAAKQAANDSRLDLLRLVEKSLDADKAENIVHVDLADKSAIADFMVIATGRNTRQLAAMAQHVAEKLGKAGIKKISIEGLSQGDWVLVDGGDIIVHLFRPEIRTLYGLEKMWGINPPTPETLQAVG